MLKHVCPHLGCKNIIPIDQSYCDEHISRHKQYDQTVRYTTDAQYHAFYISGEWERVKVIINNKYHGLCLWTYYHGFSVSNKIVYIVPSKPIHHIIPLRDDWSKRLDIDNLVPLSQDAHALVEAEYRKGEHSKTLMQKELFNLITKYDKEFGSK